MSVVGETSKNADTRNIDKKCKDNSKMGVREISCENWRWMDRVQWWASISAVLNIRILPSKC